MALVAFRALHTTWDNALWEAGTLTVSRCRISHSLLDKGSTPCVFAISTTPDSEENSETGY